LQAISPWILVPTFTRLYCIISTPEGIIRLKSWLFVIDAVTTITINDEEDLDLP
jgi:hypothetical protein